MTKDGRKTTVTYNPDRYPVELEYLIRKYLFTGKSDHTEVVVLEVFDKLVMQTGSNMPLLKSWLINTIIVLDHKAWQLGTPLKKVLLGINSMLEIIELMEEREGLLEIARLRKLIKEHINLILQFVNLKTDTDLLAIKVKRYIQAHFHRELTIKDVAEAVGVDQSVLRSIIVQEFGLSFHEYIISIKINEAKKMLLGTSFSVAAIASQLGFRDAGYFIRVFKSLEGTTPGQFARRKNLDQITVIGREKISLDNSLGETMITGKAWIQKERDIWVSFLGGDYQITVTMLNKLFEEIHEDMKDLDYLKAYALKFITVFTRKSMQIGIPVDDILNNLTIINSQVRALMGSTYVRDFMLRIIKELLERVTVHYHEANFRVVEAVKKYIKHNYFRPIQLGDLAQLVSFSPYHLSRLFTKLTGLTMYNYITSIRIEEAKKLICTTDYTIEEIAERVGYQDSSHFMTLFKKKVGQTPRKFAELFSIQFAMLDEKTSEEIPNYLRV